MTRQIILEAAFKRFHEGGFGATTLDQVLAGTGVTKGALYHHFPNKQALGYAVIDELIRDFILCTWVEPLAQAEDPVEALQDVVAGISKDMPEGFLALGCPLNNLTQELAGTDEGFRTRLARIYDDWRRGIADALRRGQATGHVRSDADPDATAAFLTAAVEGMSGSVKAARSTVLETQLVNAFCQLIEGLRPAGATQGAAASD